MKIRSHGTHAYGASTPLSTTAPGRVGPPLSLPGGAAPCGGAPGRCRLPPPPPPPPLPLPPLPQTPGSTAVGLPSGDTELPPRTTVLGGGLMGKITPDGVAVEPRAPLSPASTPPAGGDDPGSLMPAGDASAGTPHDSAPPPAAAVPVLGPTAAMPPPTKRATGGKPCDTPLVAAPAGAAGAPGCWGGRIPRGPGDVPPPSSCAGST